jgi:hypothetical protein
MAAREELGLAANRAWTAARRPLLVAGIFGCAASLMASGRLSLRLAAPATVYWSFVPLVEIASFAAVWRRKREAMRFSRAIDLFFWGHGPWLFWLAGFAALWAFVPAARVYRWTFAGWAWYGSALAVAAWSASLDYRFFRSVLRRSAGGALGSLLAQRAIAWVAGLAWFVGSAAWQVTATRLGL